MYRGRWHLRINTHDRGWVNVPVSARNKSEARRFAVELQLKEDRVRQGLEAPPQKNSDETFGEMVQWWIDAYLARSRSYSRSLGTVRRLLGSELAPLTPAQVTARRPCRSTCATATSTSRSRPTATSARTSSSSAARSTASASARRRRHPPRSPGPTQPGPPRRKTPTLLLRRCGRPTARGCSTEIPGVIKPQWFPPLPAVGATGFEPARRFLEKIEVRCDLRRDFPGAADGWRDFVRPGSCRLVPGGTGGFRVGVQTRCKRKAASPRVPPTRMNRRSFWIQLRFQRRARVGRNLPAGRRRCSR
jgi:hypothetical protein